MRVLLVGDIHGRHLELARLLTQARAQHRIKAAIQVGDFGFFEDDLAASARSGLRFPVPLHVIDGNHEDHPWLNRALHFGAAAQWAEQLNLIYHPRASSAIVGASRVGFIGGALHVDRPQRHNLLAGFPNYILKREREAALLLFNQQQPELIVTHSCPCGIGIGMRGTGELDHGVLDHIVRAGFDPGPPHDCGDAELSSLWGELTYKPRAWVFGHFHRARDITIDDTRFVSLSSEFDSMLTAPVIWDTSSKRLVG